MKLWYQKPAERWSEALPIGNGRLGGMVYGKTDREIIQLNEDSIWSGKAVDRHNPDALNNLSEIRRFLREGKINAAESLSLLALSGVPQSQRSYQTAGELHIEFSEMQKITRYERCLDLDCGIVSVTYETEDTKFTREIFASYPNNVIAMRFRTAGKEKLSFKIRFERCGNWLDEVETESRTTIRMYANTGKDSISFCTQLKVGSCNGNVKTIGEFLVVEDASEVTMYLSTNTSFRSEAFKELCKTDIEKAIVKSYEEVKKEHMEDYTSLYRRVEVSLGDDEKDKIPTDERLYAIKQSSNDVGLISLYFQYGRYLMISGSREGSLPLTLQGIWNDSLNPPWNSKYTININTEMNYWLAESANLSECHLPYFDLLAKVKENGKETARRMYGCKGSLAHHNIDIYADTAPQDHYLPATFWVMGEAWLATHIWEHYMYTKDEEFLERNFDVLQQSMEFFYDFLIEGPEGTLVTSPSVSPENTYIMEDGTRGTMTEGATMDYEILYELGNGYINSCRILQKGSDKIQRAQEMLDLLPKLRIGKYGQLMEWMYDYEEDEPGHRHISHLYAIYPGTFLSIKDSPELMEAAKISLCRRLANGGGHTGWSRAWIVGLWARFNEGEKAYDNLVSLLSDSTFPNMMDNIPFPGGNVFQIDGNLGGAAAFVEMLVQSHGGYIKLLPAVGEKMSDGFVSGICLRGGITLSMKWKKGRVVYFSLKTPFSQQIELHYNNNVELIILDKDKEYTSEIG